MTRSEGAKQKGKRKPFLFQRYSIMAVLRTGISSSLRIAFSRSIRTLDGGLLLLRQFRIRRFSGEYPEPSPVSPQLCDLDKEKLLKGRRHANNILFP
ncbi:MAG: hypothetical protein HRU72_03740 [Planctomycetia bacterium]|uniref:hypothetical protein n=1 Tax=Candidatus Brocadia sapporoensis TaxID=392547 RepID=UPI0011787F46|nr:hypothetical protein [Candidatus Brocadia sapporoensis]MCC7238424.1 hypothetical protein [Candidatus Brocadia sp.]MDG6005502.1 hypothetical protein [Candidatus Brocadia sp.]QOJ05722.1 MAG: hypothetical protein HRU72_03740 [Planctomycetia bacterium]HQU31193.1 hypothetical protein [Candidatus Brocadia sapporoensis]